MREAELSMLKRIGRSDENMLNAQSNLATSYDMLGQTEECLRIRRDVYAGYLKLKGGEDEETLRAANNYATSLVALERFEEAKSLLREMTPVARQALRESHRLTLKMRWAYAVVLFKDRAATLDDIHEAVTTLESVAPLWKRVFGQAHPETHRVQTALKQAREMLALAHALATHAA